MICLKWFIYKLLTYSIILKIVLLSCYDGAVISAIPFLLNSR